MRLFVSRTICPAVSVSSTTARRNPCVILFPAVMQQLLSGSRRAAVLLSVFTQSRDRLTTAYRAPLTSLSTQNRLCSVNTSLIGHPIRESVADWWSCHIPQGMLLRAFARNQQYVFMPLLTSFRNAFTLTVSGYVVAILYCIFTIIKLPSTER